MGHSVSKNAENAVNRGEKMPDKAALTVEQRIAEIRKNVAAGLSVPGHEIKLLLSEYDATKILLAASDAVASQTQWPVEGLSEAKFEPTPEYPARIAESQ